MCAHHRMVLTNNRFKLGVLLLGLLISIGLGMLLGREFFAPGGTDAAERLTGPNPVDIGFSQSMAIHHGQAIQMALLVRASSEPGISRLAESIVLSQTWESGLLDGWLSAWGAPKSFVGAPMEWVKSAVNVQGVDDQLFVSRCKANDGAMPGMPTTEQMNRLKTLRGKDQGQLFLELMIAHHQGALPMAYFAFNNGHLPLVKSFALNMAKEQNNEVAVMQRLLERYKKIGG